MTIQELRKAKGLTQGKFAESIGISRTAIVGYEAGKFKPKEAVIARIKEVYDVEIDDVPAEQAAPANSENKPAKKKRAVKKEKAPGKKKRAEKKGTPAAAMRALRKEKGLSQKAFGASIGVSLPTICAYEGGRIRPSGKVTERVKEVYGVDIAELETAPIQSASVKAPKTGKRGQKKAEKPAAAEKKTAIIIQSPLGGSITPEEIAAKVGEADIVYVRVDENKAYWVKGDENGAVDLW